MTDLTSPRRANPVAGKVLILMVIVLCAALAIGLAQTSAGGYLLREAGLSARPAGFTSLAFADPQSLPARLPSSVRTSFTVTNTSGDPHSYQWSISMDHAGHTTPLAAGQVSVPAGGSTTVTRTVTASCANGQARMTVRLAAPAESIDFWAACSPGGKR
jgi:hypothetical protein